MLQRMYTYQWIKEIQNEKYHENVLLLKRNNVVIFPITDRYS